MKQEQFIRNGIRYIEEKRLIKPESVVVLGLSGGADSLALLFLLLEYQKRVPFLLRALHVEHGIRGGESLADAGYVRQVCERFNVPCQIVHVDVPAYARQQKQSIEEAARNLRYQALYEHAAGASIAVAHHMDDQAETVLLSLARGSGLKGLGGMHEKNGQIIRPLLWARRKEIEEFLEEKQMYYLTDQTNLDAVYARNRIRHNVMPQLLAVNAQATRHICQAAQKLRQAEDYIQEQLQLGFDRTVRKDRGGYVIEKESLEELHPFLQERVILETLTQLAGRQKDLTQVHVQAVWELFSRQSGRCAVLPYRMLARRTADGVWIGCGTEADAWKNQDWPFAIEKEQIHWEIVNWDGSCQISKKKYTKWFDYDKIKGSVRIRHRQSGDVLLLADGHTQKLKKYMINEKIPEQERDHLWLLADDVHVLWIVGYRISDYDKVTEDTKRVLKVQVDGGEQHE